MVTQRNATETVTRVLELAGQPMRAREIHAAAEHLIGEVLRWTSVSQTSRGSSGGSGE